MDIAEITAGLSGIKTALDILKALKKSNASSSILSEISDLQSALIEVQQGVIASNQTHSADVDRIRNLEEEVTRLKAWGADKQRYELKNVWNGAMVYTPKADMRGGEPPHWLCANCYTQGKKSFLSSIGGLGGEAVWVCSNCPTKFRISAGVAPT